MQPYIGTKKIYARPMTRLDYNEYRGWKLPDDENGDDEGYLVEYTDGGQANHPDHKGYISWSPKAVFEQAYQINGEMSFGHALEMAKSGYKITRAGWNGKDMWVIYVPGQENVRLYPNTPYHDHLGDRIIEILPHLDMYTTNAHGRRAMLPGWLASQSDMLANDWMAIE